MNALALILLAIWASVFSSHESVSPTPINVHRKRRWNHILLLIGLVALASGAFICQLVVAHRHSAYDTDAIKYYSDKFDSIEKKRVAAAAALKEYHQKGNWDAVTSSTYDLDYVLGFFDNLGYDEQHGRISAEVAWEYFYDDIANYYQGSSEYIANTQKDDPTWFENIKPLFDDVTRIEAQRRHRLPAELRISDKDYLDYLQSEIDLKNDK